MCSSNSRPMLPFKIQSKLWFNHVVTFYRTSTLNYLRIKQVHKGSEGCQPWYLEVTGVQMRTKCETEDEEALVLLENHGFYSPISSGLAVESNCRRNSNSWLFYQQKICIALSVTECVLRSDISYEAEWIMCKREEKRWRVTRDIKFNGRFKYVACEVSQAVPVHSSGNGRLK